ncbi:ATPase [Alicyclobacillus fastidiosus]|uniref:ATPase n=1 Tax=Alicyclobacillus fastidiosus TaxID=392011 RepID=A0ABY6ZL17_9BACL|nr:BadF/BadG/BcrA/BcrD ATPase family protein [Alicyclobacillus fastidiosus]WAH43162.1 ATPase [Alicyclobacillus fastidiosus]GMA65178.1 kinase [Alicyclobacillus fastidiosus]
MKYVLGLDGGGSKTFAVVVNEHGDLLGKGVAGHGNYQNSNVRIGGALANYKAAILQALGEANLTIEQIDFAQFGLAGADREKDFRILRPAVASLGFRNWDIVCDTYEGLRTGSRDNVGVVLVCGSGTNAAGRNPAGETKQIGGFGYLFGDTAGGHHLAQEAFRAACRDFERRGPSTSLRQKIASYYDKRDMDEVLDHYYDNELYHTHLDMCKLLHEAADEGDEVSVRILECMGRELGIAANSVIYHLGGFDDMDIPIVLVGSVIQKGRSKFLLQALHEEIAKEHQTFHLVIPEMAPAFGAALIGMDQLGIHVSQSIEEKFISYGGYQ